MLRTLLVVLAHFLALAPTARAGNWISGGGTLYKDANNSWFLGNVDVVNYCIVRDAAHVSASIDLIDTMIQRSVAYWQDQFTYAEYDGHATTLRAATQRFVRGDCPPRLEDALERFDIVFQFGVLTAEQRAYLRDPTEFIASTVRTDYDPRRLRGKGFVYFSADSGPLRYRGDVLRDRGWSVERGGPLLHVLMHELGHVFGLAHTGSMFELMGEGYPGFVLRDLGDGSSISPETTFNFFKFDQQFFRGLPPDQMVCLEADAQMVLQPLLRFFFVDDSVPCVRLKVDLQGAQLHYKESKRGPEILAGVLPFDDDLRYQSEDDRYLAGLGITDEQDVFSGLSDFEKSFGLIAGAKVREYWRTGTYRSANGPQTRTVQMRLSPRGLMIGGLDQEKIVHDIFRLMDP